MIESPVSHPLRKWTQTEVYLKWFGKNWRKYIWRPGRVLLQVKWGNMSIVELLITGSVSSSRPVVLMLSCQDRRQCGGGEERKTKWHLSKYQLTGAPGRECPHNFYICTVFSSYCHLSWTLEMTHKSEFWDINCLLQYIIAFKYCTDIMQCFKRKRRKELLVWIIIRCSSIHSVVWPLILIAPSLWGVKISHLLCTYRGPEVTEGQKQNENIWWYFPCSTQRNSREKWMVAVRLWLHLSESQQKMFSSSPTSSHFFLLAHCRVTSPVLDFISFWK